MTVAVAMTTAICSRSDFVRSAAAVYQFHRPFHSGQQPALPFGAGHRAAGVPSKAIVCREMRNSAQTPAPGGLVSTC